MGWCQDWFMDEWMKKGGCAAVTACDLCIELARLEGRTELYPYDAGHVTRADYADFSRTMKPYLRPRWTGIDRLEIYIEGLSAYWRDCGVNDLRLKGVEGAEAWEVGREAVRAQIDAGRVVPCLVLRHRSKAFNFYEWHWFNLAGYEAFEDELYVKAVTYGDWRWLSLRELWDNGYDRKGGLILVQGGESNHLCPVKDQCGRAASFPSVRR